MWSTLWCGVLLGAAIVTLHHRFHVPGDPAMWISGEKQVVESLLVPFGLSRGRFCQVGALQCSCSALWCRGPGDFGPMNGMTSRSNVVPFFSQLLGIIGGLLAGLERP